MKKKVEIINHYYNKLKSANKEATKKEHFKDLLNRLYHDDANILTLVDAISSGAEKAIVNIPRKDKLRRGSADTLYNRVIIEFENSLKLTLEHAKEQLAGYFLGQFKSGEGYNFTLIASDFISWKVFVPDVTQLNSLESIQEHELILKEVKGASFILTESNGEDFYYWLDRFLFKEEQQHATLKRIEGAFGYQSTTFIESYRQLAKIYNEAKENEELKVSYEQWKKFLSIAYGSFQDSEDDFIIHTYLSIFAKMLAYAVVSNDDYIDDAEMRGILDGSIFDKYKINNFIDNDFFHWVKSSNYFDSLKKTFRLIAQEISTFDFNHVDEDVLKGVYQELIDLDTRHSLGEYYTPDWLCERVVKEFDFKTHNRILDPSCGSGSFLRAAIHRIKELNPNATLDEINSCIYGIDIHPLSVQIAKTTVLLALGKGVSSLKKPIHINIILANTLLAPEGVRNLFGDDFSMFIDKEKYYLTTQILDDVKLFDEALEVCDKLAETTKGEKPETIKVFENILRKRYPSGGYNRQIIESFYSIYEGFKHVKEVGRDSIWKFIIQNLYKPYFLSDSFDYIIGNPPWFTFSSIRNEEYQNILNALAENNYVRPENRANYPHLEIAAIFLSYCSTYFLKEKGKIAFVLPRSFFSADHHDNSRRGKAKGFKLYNIWDLEKVSPLFRVPSGVLFAEKAVVLKGLPAGGLAGKLFSGTLPAHNCNLKLAEKRLTEQDVKWFYIKRGKSSAFSTKNVKSVTLENPYKKKFKQGATILPRNFYFIDLAQEWPDDFSERIICIETADAVKPDAKKPWKNIELKGKIESQFFFRTALSKSILPYSLFRPDLIVLPLSVNVDNRGLKKIQLHSTQELLEEGYLEAHDWFKQVNAIWEARKTEKNKNMSATGYVDWLNKLTKQDLNLPYVVLYNSSAKDANAAVIERSELDFEFIIDHKAYFFATNSLDEAYYLAAILNSKIPNELMKAFQTRGLFGARDVHKKILDGYFPKFNPAEDVHLEIANQCKQLHKMTKEFLEKNEPKQVNALILGRLRVSIKQNFEHQMKALDKLIKKVL